MGNYTIRTSDQEDIMIKDAQEYIGASTVSKAFLASIAKYKEHEETIFKLRQDLEKERNRSQKMSASISDFESSMARLFASK